MFNNPLFFKNCLHILFEFICVAFPPSSYIWLFVWSTLWHPHIIWYSFDQLLDIQISSDICLSILGHQNILGYLFKQNSWYWLVTATVQGSRVPTFLTDKFTAMIHSVTLIKYEYETLLTHIYFRLSRLTASGWS